MRALLITCLLIVAALAGIASTAARADETIYDIRTGVYPEGTIVECDSVVVTAVGMFVYFVQEPEPHPSLGWRYSAIQVYTAANHTVHKGDMVKVKGEYTEFRGMSEIDATGSSGLQVYLGPGTIPDPVDVLISEVNETGAYSEDYEGSWSGSIEMIRRCIPSSPTFTTPGP